MALLYRFYSSPHATLLTQPMCGHQEHCTNATKELVRVQFLAWRKRFAMQSAIRVASRSRERSHRAASLASVVHVKEDMEKFFGQFEKLKSDENERLDEMERKIVSTLEGISSDLARSGNMPQRKDVADERKLLEHRQKELSKSESTARTLQEKRARLQKDMANVNQLESKIQTEMEQLDEKINMMTQELVTYNDIDGLREVTDRRKRQLLANRERLVLRRDTSKRVLAEMAAQYEGAKTTLLADVTYTQLQALEKKWQSQERANHQHKHYILTQETESNFKPYVKQVTQIMKEYNGELKTREPVKVPLSHAV